MATRCPWLCRVNLVPVGFLQLCSRGSGSPGLGCLSGKGQPGSQREEREGAWWKKTGRGGKRGSGRGLGSLCGGAVGTAHPGEQRDASQASLGWH